MKEIQSLPYLDESSFEAFINKHTKQIKYGEYHFVGIQKPRNSTEFREITKRLYGVELDVSCYVYPVYSFSTCEYSANYKVLGTVSVYAREGIMPLWEKRFGQYDGLKVLLDWCFGDVFCGGVAGAHYGQTKVPTKKDYVRVQNWGNQKANYTKAVVDQHNSLVEIFGHNPLTQ